MKSVVPCFIFSLFLAACGHGVGDYQVPKDFQPYIAQFQTDAASQGKSVSVHDLVINFGTTGNEIEGQCVLSAGAPQILINKDEWTQASDVGKQILLYHELGHCVLSRVHTMDTLNDGDGDYPASIMFPYVISDEQFLLHQDHYLQELFNGAS